MERDALLAQAARRIRWRERVFGAAAGLMPPRPAGWTDGAPILLYHRVAGRGSGSSDPFAVTEDAFARQIAWLAERWTLVTVGTLVKRLAGGDASGLAAVTFDDGFQCTVARALPVLRARGVPATVFVDTGRLNGGPLDLRDDDVRALAGAGVEIGSHSVSHSDLTRLDDRALRSELIESRERLSALTGTEIAGFAHPFGHYDQRVLRAVAACGYEYACTCRQHRTNLPGDDPYQLTRTEINLGDGPRRFVAKLEGRYAPLYRAFYRINPATRDWVRDR